MSKVYGLVSVMLVLSLASTSFGLVIGDFEGGLDGWGPKDATLTLGATGATLGAGALQVAGPGGWHIDALLDMKPIRTELGVNGVVITADVTAFEADMTSTWMQVEMVINAQNNNDAGANNNIGWKGLGGQNIVRDGQPHTYTWVLPEALTTAIAGTDPNIWWFELALVSNLDGASVTKFYIDKIQIVPPTPPAAKRVIFVSFHGADDAPSSGAAGNGFTEAPDKMYTDLLKIKGYDVARYISTKTPDVNVLNAADLVIIGRSVDSGHYANDAATTWNAKVTAPMIITGGYPLRKSRMGFTTGTTIPDTTGDIRLTTTDPNHPIFAGIALTNGTMDSPYAGIATYPTDGTVARGISVNTDPLNGGGVILATIAGPADPNDPNDPTDSFDPITGPIGGVIIAEWPAGATLTHDGGAGTDVLGGRRLVFLTGAREASGKSSQTAGQYDLSPEGMMMFLNAVEYMLNPPPAPAVSMLTNGGFEDGVRDPWGVYGPETLITQVVTELTDANVPEAVIEGTFCLYVNLPAATANFWEAGLQPKPVVFEKGKKYTLSAFMKAKKGTLQINMKPELAGAPWTPYGEKMMTVTEQWKEYSVTTPVFPADTTPAGITFHIGSAVGGFWIDGVRFYEGDYVKP